ncbi:MAG: ATP-binding protein [Methylococcales bacterium]|nr:ATP-binding protein [Methylococcales bacterium]
MALPINVEDLLSAQTVESDRIEYKEGWNPDAIYRTICAFANDFDNTGGGYICIGVEEDAVAKIAKRPVKGLSTAELSEIQVKMIGFNNLILPSYHAKLFIEQVDGRQMIVLWIPGGSNRPYQVPEYVTSTTKRYFYYIRKYANSVKANIKEQQELISLANQVPFDDRPNTQAQVDNISLVLVKDYLQKIQSKLAEDVGKKTDLEILGQMELISGPSEHVYPRNVALMLFTEKPDKYFPYTQVDIVDFPEGEANPYTETEPIKGPVPSQIKRTLDFLKDKIIKEKVIKPTDKAESTRITSYPLQAIEEILVNAFYHRDYQQREPIEIRIYPNSIVFINHGGPDRSIQLQSFNTGQVRSRRYRNRRLGEFLKELGLTEGRATGIPTVLKALKDNGSPPPNFKSDDDRTFFEVEIFSHPAFVVSKVIVEVEGLDNLKDIDIRLDQLLAITLDGPGDKVGDIAGDVVNVQAGAIADDAKSLDNRAVDIVSAVDDAIVSAIADAIDEILSENVVKVLRIAKQARSREAILNSLKVTNHRKNYERYMLPLVELNWLTMTIPDKPTSPKQQYLNTIKGRLILEFLKHKTT